MAWIESHQTLDRHPTLLQATVLLGVSKPALIGHLHLLWHWALDFAQDGDLTCYSMEQIAMAAEWPGDPRAFVEALIECGPGGRAGFLDNPDHERLLLHDWYEYGGKLIEARKQNAERQKAHRERHKDDHNAAAPVRKPNATTPAPLHNGRSNADVTVTSPLRTGATEQDITVEDITDSLTPAGSRGIGGCGGKDPAEDAAPAAAPDGAPDLDAVAEDYAKSTDANVVTVMGPREVAPEPVPILNGRKANGGEGLPTVMPLSVGGQRMPPDVLRKIQRRDELYEAARQLSSTGKLPERHKGLLERFVTEYGDALSSEIIQDAADEAARYTEGDCIAYLLTVMVNRIKNPDARKPQKGPALRLLQPEEPDLYGDVPPKGYSWARSEDGRFKRLGRDPVTGLLPWGGTDTEEDARREKEAQVAYAARRAAGKTAPGMNGAGKGVHA